MTQDDNGTADDAGMPAKPADAAAAATPDPPKRQESFDFRSPLVGLLAIVTGAVVGIIVGAVASISVWAILLFFVAFAVIVGVIASSLPKTKWFYPAMAVVLAAVLAVSGVYVLQHAKHGHTKGTTAAVIKAPTLGIVVPRTTPWCLHTVEVTADGTVPVGYEIAIFDVEVDSNGNPTGLYNFDGRARPSVPGEWLHHNIYVGSRYRVDDNGHTIHDKSGHPESNAGFTAHIVAALVTNKYFALLDGVKSIDGWGLRRLPRSLTTQQQLVTRTAVARLCPSS